jgi:hypothetical protein
MNSETGQSERRGSADTTHAKRYLQQLCKHWSHKFAVEVADDSGAIDLPAGRVLMRAEASRLVVTIEPGPEGDGARLQQVFEEHINRFAFREAPLPFEWTIEERVA